MNLIIKLQAWARGNKARKQVNFMKSKQIGSSKYFTMVEFKETVSPRRSKAEFGKTFGNTDDFVNQTREKRAPYTYKTGAIYTGEWKGGFRDGQGKMTWSDGASYDGEWLHNKAYGFGKFNHADGDLYQGNWANDKTNGVGVYLHVNGAKYQGEWKDDQ